MNTKRLVVTLKSGMGEMTFVKVFQEECIFVP